MYKALIKHKGNIMEDRYIIGLFRKRSEDAINETAKKCQRQIGYVLDPNKGMALKLNVNTTESKMIHNR